MTANRLHQVFDIGYCVFGIAFGISALIKDGGWIPLLWGVGICIVGEIAMKIYIGARNK